MSTPTTDASTEDWDRAVRERRRRTPSTNTSTATSSDISSAVPTNPDNTPTEEYDEMVSRQIAKTAAMEAASYANKKAAVKEARKQKYINHIKSGEATQRQINDFKSIYDDDIREEFESARPSALNAASEAMKRKSPNTPRSPVTTPIPIPFKNNPKSYLGGRTKRRSRKGIKTRREKRVIKSKKAKKAHRSKKYKKMSRKGKLSR